jgi:hypothetical protein
MLLRSIAAGSLRTRSSFPHAFSGNPGETYNVVVLAPSPDCAYFCALSARERKEWRGAYRVAVGFTTAR